MVGIGHGLRRPGSLTRRAAIGGCAALAPLLLSAASAQAPGPPPRLSLEMTPHAAGRADDGIDVRMTMEKPGLRAGDPLVRLPAVIVGVPGARYLGDGLQARDDRGVLPLTQDEEPATPQQTYRRWKLGRDTVGDVVVSYRAPPRRVTASTNNGPLFDLREAAGGFIGAGVTFLAVPAKPGPWRVKLHWNLSDAPAGSRGSWSFGDGDVETIVPSDALAFSSYAVGPLHSLPPAGSDRFALYWLEQPPFDAKLLGDRLLKLYTTMADFWGDKGSSYKVFMRQNPYPGKGGTGLAKSFIFGFRASDRPSVDDLQYLLAHEIAHNWPSMQGEHADTAWYSEGTAEYYSMLLANRAGILPSARFLADLNRRTYDYYTNPFRGLTNREAAALFWTDPTAQTVPYGRGFLYLMRTDAAIRTASGGKRSLDDVVLALRRRQVAGESYGISDWLRLVGAELGDARTRTDYDAMVAGKTLDPPASRFAPCFGLKADTARVFDLGFARSSIAGQSIKGLEPNSEAAKAGVREGDEIVEAGDLSRIRSDASLPMTLTLKRDGRTISVSYPPRGALVASRRWVRDPRAPEASCRF